MTADKISDFYMQFIFLAFHVSDLSYLILRKHKTHLLVFGKIGIPMTMRK
jgi:hypothetical protein